ncbi:hypothetical protein RKD45_001152 [Streptomyces griseus]
MLLADDLVQGAGTHPDSEGAAGRVLLLAVFGCCGKEVGLHAGKPMSPHRQDRLGRQLVQKSHQRVRISMPMIPIQSTGGTQWNSVSAFRSQAGAGRMPCLTLCVVT